MRSPGLSTRPGDTHSCSIHACEVPSRVICHPNPVVRIHGQDSKRIKLSLQAAPASVPAGSGVHVCPGCGQTVSLGCQAVSSAPPWGSDCREGTRRSSQEDLLAAGAVTRPARTRPGVCGEQLSIVGSDSRMSTLTPSPGSLRSDPQKTGTEGCLHSVQPPLTAALVWTTSCTLPLGPKPPPSKIPDVPRPQSAVRKPPEASAFCELPVPASSRLPSGYFPSTRSMQKLFIFGN